VTVGTVFERSKIPLNIWLQAVFLLCSSKKGMSAHQLHRTLGVTYKTAWFMSHRIRKAMETHSMEPMGGTGGIVEADETYWGTSAVGKRNQRVGRRIPGGSEKMKVFSLIERGGQARSFAVTKVNARTLAPILRGQVSKETHLMTDEARVYITVGREFAGHSVVKHWVGEYVRGNAHTNTAESFFNILKRGLIGTYHHVGEQHLQKYVSEFDFRYNNRTKLGVSDAERTAKALKGITGKRLTYRRIDA
jgi:transposase-like protein